MVDEEHMAAVANRTEDPGELAVYTGVNEELRRFYDYIVKAFEHLRNKCLALLVGEVAIVTFLFQDFKLDDLGANPPIYGYVTLGLSIFLLVLSYAMFLFVISTIKWKFPTEQHDMKNPTERFKGNPLNYQKYLHAEYIEKVGYCNGKLMFRSKVFMLGTYALSAGVFLAILVRYGGGA